MFLLVGFVSPTTTRRRAFTVFMSLRGVAHLVVHGTSGSTSYETIPPVRLETVGGVLSTVDMVMQRRDGPRRLRDHDDDDDDVAAQKIFARRTLCEVGWSRVALRCCDDRN